MLVENTIIKFLKIKKMKKTKLSDDQKKEIQLCFSINTIRKFEYIKIEKKQKRISISQENYQNLEAEIINQINILRLVHGYHLQYIFEM